MTKDDVFKLVIGALVLFMVLALAVGEATTQDAYDKVAAILATVLVLALISLGAERGSELLKMVLRFAFG